MDLVYLKKLLKIFDESTATGLTINEEGIKIQLSKNLHNANQVFVAPSYAQPNVTGESSQQVPDKSPGKRKCITIIQVTLVA